MTTQIQHHPVHNPIDRHRGAIEMAKNISIAVAEGNRHFYSLQIEAAQAALEKNTQQFRSRLKQARDRSTALEQWSVLFLTKIQKLAEANGAWVESTSRTISEMNELMGAPLLALGKTDQKADRQKAKAPDDRRVIATMIAFPERRTAAMINAAISGTHAAGKKRHAG